MAPPSPDPLPPGLRRELGCLPPGLARALLRPLVGDDKAPEVIRAGLCLAASAEPMECRRAFGRLGRFPAGSLRAWWLRSVFDLPGRTAPLGRALGAFLSSPDAALEFIQKASAVLRRLDPGTGRELLGLTARLARREPAAALEVFLSAPDCLAGLTEADRTFLLRRARCLDLSPGAAAGLLASARPVLDQAGRKGLGRWIDRGRGLNGPAQEAFFRLDSPASLQALDQAAGGLSQEAARPVLELYARALTGRRLLIRPLADGPEGLLISPLAAGGLEGDRVFLPAREWGRDPLAVFRARLALVLSLRPAEWDFLLSFADPWLAADLWSLAQEGRSLGRLLRRLPGLAAGLRELQRGRRRRLKRSRLVLHPALRAAALRLWGGRPRLDADTDRLAGRVADKLMTGPDPAASVRRAYELLSADDWARPVEETEPKLKFGTIEQGRLFESGVGLKPGQADRVLTLSRDTGRQDWLASLDRLSQRLRQTGEPGQNGRGVLYPEWDADLGAYRPGWVRVVESEVQATDGSPAPPVPPDARPGLILQVRRQFQRLRHRGLERLGGQLDGQEVDLEAAVAWAVDRLRGASPEDKVYLSRRLVRREVAALLLIDLSGSTAEKLVRPGPSILDTARESLIVLAEALAALGDSFGLFGFSGTGRSRVDFLILKDFHEPWPARTRARLNRLRPGQQNRDGAAIRHAAARLKAWPARQRILILLSDGRPDDYDYSGAYACADTRTALREARQSGLRTFCLTIDAGAREYLEEMLGATGFCVLDDVRRLPRFLPQLYRRLAG